LDWWEGGKGGEERKKKGIFGATPSPAKKESRSCPPVAGKGGSEATGEKRKQKRENETRMLAQQPPVENELGAEGNPSRC